MNDDNNDVRKRLYEAYNKNEKGTWKILGEDPNCDFNGPHHEPELEVVTGTYANVVEYALTLSSFFTWGQGGRIVKAKGSVKNVDKISLSRIKELKVERAKLVKCLEDIDLELKSLVDN